MECPNCKLVNPAQTTRCDCGYDFQTRTLQQSYLIERDKRLLRPRAVGNRTKKLAFWILFVLCQIVGFILPFFANIHSNPAPLILGICLLLPGSVAAFIFPNLPPWLLTGTIVALNALVWVGVWKGGKADSDADNREV